MCGIAGIVGLNAGEKPSREMASMLGSLSRRGPDDEGMYTWPTASFAHRRLAIIDLSPAGHQPMLSEDGRIGLVFNGCIYNFQELRSELEALGHVFHSHCDTEVILRGYLAWGGQALVPRLRGMFAFAIWDDRQRKLTLARDRLGVKPLCYATRGSRFAFASTPAALDAAGFAGDIDPQAVLEFLEFGFVTEQHCIFKNVHKVPPATLIEWQNGRLASSVYWQQSTPQANGIGLEEALRQTEILLLDAVRLRLCADVPISALLSSGIDSTLICWALSELKANLCAFTVSLPGEPEDEARLAAVTAEKIGIPHQTIPMPAIDEEVIDTEIRAYSEPFSAYSALGMLQLSKAIKPFATVMLTGDGGDEAFLGYPLHLHAYRAQHLANRLPSLSPSAWRMLRPAVHRISSLRRPKHFLDYATGGLGALTRVHDGLPYYQHKGLLGARLREGTVRQREITPSLESARRLLAEVLDYNKDMEFVSEFLTKVDGATMYYAIEARSPFLDHRIWEFASSLDYGLRLQGGRLKNILRELVRRKVGADVAARPKRGFQMPVEKWLVTRWRGKLEELSGRCQLTEQGWIQQESLVHAVHSAVDKGAANIHLWRLVLLNTWLQGRSSERVTDAVPEESAPAPAGAAPQ